ncbi:MAG: helix-turn-helix domain-containing protein [Thermoplasmata archaeon]
MQALRLLGMGPREARMYLSLVRGPLGAREASELVGLHRATGYRMLVRLIDRGMVLGNGRTPQLFVAVPPQVLFHRLELAYRDEAEIAALMPESVVGVEEAGTMSTSPFSVPAERTQFVCGEGRSNHPALAKLAEARNSAAIVVPPLSLPVPYRLALADAIGHLARHGVHIRLILDATPADYRFVLALLREPRSSTSSLQARHFAPLATHLYVIDRRRVVRLPVLGASNRHSPVGILLEDLSLVRAQISRFESLWSEASDEFLAARRTRTRVR